MSFIAALIGGALALGGEIFGNKSTNNANKQMNAAQIEAQLEVTRQTNEANLQIAREQNQTNIQLQREMNEYNSPSNQRMLYEQAGFNPYLVADGASFNSAQTSTPQQVTPQMQSPQLPNAIPHQSMRGVFSEAISNIVNSYMGIQEGKGVGLENELKAIRNYFARDNYNDSNRIKKADADYAEQTLQARVQRQRVEVAGQEMELSVKYLNKIKMIQELSVYPQQLQLQLAQQTAELIGTYASIGKTYAETKLAIQNTLKSIAETHGIEQSNEIRAATSDALIRSLISEYDYKSVSNQLGKMWSELDIKYFDGELLAKEIEYQQRGLPKNAKDALQMGATDSGMSSFYRKSSQFLLYTLYTLEFLGAAVNGTSYQPKTTNVTNHNHTDNVNVNSNKQTTINN